ISMSLMKCKWLTGLMLLSIEAFCQTASVKHEFSVHQCADYAEKNSALVKNALIDIELQEQQNRGITAEAYPQLNASFNTQYNPNVTIQTFPNFIALGTYGVLEAEGVKNGNGDPIKTPTDIGL